jgi:hypothetical protein
MMTIIIIIMTLTVPVVLDGALVVAQAAVGRAPPHVQPKPQRLVCVQSRHVLFRVGKHHNIIIIIMTVHMINIIGSGQQHILVARYDMEPTS